MSEKKVNSLENALIELEKIVSVLEQGELPLEDAISIYEKGVKLTSKCNAELKSAKLKIEELKNENNGENND